MVQPERFLLPAAAALEPYQQGELDGLCGIYSVINAARLALWPNIKLSKVACGQLLEAALRSVGRGRAVARTAREGMEDGDLPRLTTAMFEHLAKCGLRLRFQRIPTGYRHTALDRQIVSALLTNQVVIVSVTHINHFTTIVGYSATRYRIHDSSGGHWIYRMPSRLSLALIISSS